jgi:hypothetical protein
MLATVSATDVDASVYTATVEFTYACPNLFGTIALGTHDDTFCDKCKVVVSLTPS